MLLFKLKSQNARKRRGYCPHQKRGRCISVHLPHEPVWRSRRFLEVTGILLLVQLKLSFTFPLYHNLSNKPFLSKIYLQIISLICGIFSLLLPPSLQSMLTFFLHSYCWKSFSLFQERWVNDPRWQQDCQGQRWCISWGCLHRLLESWGGTNGHGHESTTVTRNSRRKVLASKYKFLGRQLETGTFKISSFLLPVRQKE